MRVFGLGVGFISNEKSERAGSQIDRTSLVSRHRLHTSPNTHIHTHTKTPSLISHAATVDTYHLYHLIPPFPPTHLNTQLNTAAVRQAADDFLQLDLDSLPSPDAQAALKQLDAAARARLAEAAQ